MEVCAYICMYRYECVNVFINVYMCLCMYVCMYLYICVHVFVCKYVRMYICMHAIM